MARFFTGRFGTHKAEVMFDRMCRENGISHKLTAPRSPTTTGKIERFHQSVRKEFLVDRTFPTIDVAQKELDGWVHDYNNERPHQSLEMAVPADRFRLVPATKDPHSVPVYSEEDENGQWVLRRVGSNGVVSVDNQMFSVGNAYKAQLVDAFVDDTTIQVWHQNHLVKTVARVRKGPVRKIRADGLHVNHQAEPKVADQPELDSPHTCSTFVPRLHVFSSPSEGSRVHSKTGADLGKYQDSAGQAVPTKRTRYPPLRADKSLRSRRS